MSDTTESHESDTVTLPYLDLERDGDSWARSLFLTLEQRWSLVERLLTDHGYTRQDVGPAWNGDPLTAWCWLVLKVNDLELDQDEHHPLTHWGIDLGFSETPLRRFVWAVA